MFHYGKHPMGCAVLSLNACFDPAPVLSHCSERQCGMSV